MTVEAVFQALFSLILYRLVSILDAHQFMVALGENNDFLYFVEPHKPIATTLAAQVPVPLITRLLQKFQKHKTMPINSTATFHLSTTPTSCSQ